MPRSPGTSTGEFVDEHDKFLHVASYAVLGGLLANALRREQSKSSILLLILTSVALAAAFGAADEWHQQFCQRTVSRQDWLADLRGAALGATVVAIVAAVAAKSGGRKWLRQGGLRRRS